MHIRRYIITACLLLIAQVLWAQSAFRPVKDTAALKGRIDNMSKVTNSIESDFTQVKDLSMLSEKITSNGHFYFQKVNKLRWEYMTPYKYIIVINQDKIFIKDEKKLKKYDINSNKVFKEINDIMVSCINGDIMRSAKFGVSFYENDKNYKLELIPKTAAMKESLKKIDMYFDKSVTSVVKLVLTEQSDDITTLDFKNKKINTPIAVETFILK